MARAQSIGLPLEFRSLLAGLASAQVADDQRWLLALMQKQGPIVAGMLFRMLGSEQDALDAYQTAVCRLIAKGKEAIGTNQGGYFYRTALNSGIETLRTRKRRQVNWPAIVDVQRRQDARRAADADRQSTAFDQREALDKMRQAIYQLPPHLRDVIVLRELADLPYRRVAAILGIQVGTARLYRRKAVMRLAGLMGQET